MRSSSSAVGRTAAPTTVRPYLLGCLAAFSVGAAAIHFAVVFEHFAEYALYGVFFLVISWAQVMAVSATTRTPSLVMDNRRWTALFPLRDHSPGAR
jgi:hypothetical protein